MGQNRPLLDTYDEVIENAVWIHQQTLDGKLSPYWYARIRLPEEIGSRKRQDVRKSTRKKNKEEAKLWATDRYHEMCGNQMLGMPAESKTFSWMFSDYQRIQGLKLQAGEISKHRFVFNEATFRNYLEPFFGQLDVRKVDVDKILEYKAERMSKMGLAGGHTVRKKTKPSAHTINRENMVLRDILKHAYEKKFINTIPSIQNNYDDKSPRLDFNAEEWTYMLKRFDEDIDKSKQEKTATHEYRYKLMLKTLCQLLAYSGGRVGGETNQSLIWDDIKVVVGNEKKQKKVEVGTNENCPYDKAQVARVEVLIRNVKYRTKPSPRLVMAIPYLERALRAWRSETQFPSGNDFIFCHQKDGTNGHPQSAIKTFRKGFERFLIRHTTSKFKLWDDNESPHRTLYSLHHTYATQRLINGDLGVYELALNMGTSIRELERTYSKALPQAFAAKLTGV